MSNQEPIPPTSQSLGGYLRSLREAKQLKLREVEQASGVSNPYLSQLEHNKINKPSPHILHKLSTVYSVPYEVLMQKAGYITSSNSPDPSGSSPALGSRIPAAALSDLTPEEEEALLNYLAFLRFKRNRD
jgi:HTH-type transcriptional regulator, competence development regulator